MPEVLSLCNGDGIGSSQMQEKYKDVQTLSVRVSVTPYEVYGFTEESKNQLDAT